MPLYSHHDARTHGLILPPNIGVASESKIKTSTVDEVLDQFQPETDFAIMNTSVPSGVPEQPLGQEAIDGALNRLAGIVKLGDGATRVCFAIENGLFKVSGTGNLDLSTLFDPTAEYEDRAVVAIGLPGRLPFVHISPAEDAVRFPRDAVRAAHDAPGGFAEHTVGSILYEAGRVHDKQDPHIDLTDGKLSRKVQMARALLDALAQLGE